MRNKWAETAKRKWFSQTMPTYMLHFVPTRLLNIAADRDEWQQNKQTKDAFSVASHNISWPLKEMKLEKVP